MWFIHPHKRKGLYNPYMFDYFIFQKYNHYIVVIPKDFRVYDDLLGNEVSVFEELIKVGEEIEIRRNKKRKNVTPVTFTPTEEGIKYD